MLNKAEREHLKRAGDAVEVLVGSLQDALLELDDLECPWCSSRRLTVSLIANDGILVTCDGKLLAHGDDDDHATEESECAYTLVVKPKTPRRPRRKAEVVSVDIAAS